MAQRLLLGRVRVAGRMEVSLRDTAFSLLTGERVLEPVRTVKKSRRLSQRAFNAMLEKLDPDRDRAGLKYEEIRRALIRYLRFQGSHIPEDHADEAINIVAERIFENKAFDAANPLPHFLAAARNILRDYWKDRGKRPLSLHDLPSSREPFRNPDEERMRLFEREQSEHQARCLDRCLSELPSQDRELIERYHLELKTENAKRRSEIAGESGRSVTALRVKVHRVRKKLERCCDNCMKDPD